ncbi:hypothetical protein K501DRAFT_188751, partial [Backusella circina FSU 941]
NDNLTPELLKTLLEIFDKFDQDKDRALNPKEWDHFVYYTNDQHPSDALLVQIAQQFGANKKGWLTLEGFLAFYLEQTLNDISETERDILKHGYDTISLKVIQ